MRTTFGTAFLVAIILATWACSTTGACLNYGHSCLGGHGKKRAEVIPSFKGSLQSATVPAMGLLGSAILGNRPWTKRILPKAAPKKYDDFWRF